MITLADIEAARRRTAAYVHRTPTVSSATLGRLLGTQVHLKLELFQRTGSFKPRVAFNKMLQMSDAERRRGVVAVSGGNHAQGVAYAAAVLGLRATICMPQNTPRNYVEATRGYGAEIDFAPDIQAAFDRLEHHTSRGAVLIHPYDDPQVMAGSGAIGLELLEDVPELTDVFLAVGGGGMMVGVTVAIKAAKPQVRVWSVETEGANCLGAALSAGKVVRIAPSGLARTLAGPYAAGDALKLAQTVIAGHTLVTDREAWEAQRLLMERVKIFPELSAATTLAAAERRKDQFSPDGQVALIICGGNVSVDDVVSYARQFA